MLVAMQSEKRKCRSKSVPVFKDFDKEPGHTEPMLRLIQE